MQASLKQCFSTPSPARGKTKRFFLYEPIVYHPPHAAQSILTHIAFIGSDYFVAGCSATERMIPKVQAQRVLNFKLSIEEIEQEGDCFDLLRVVKSTL